MTRVQINLIIVKWVMKYVDPYAQLYYVHNVHFRESQIRTVIVYLQCFSELEISNKKNHFMGSFLSAKRAYYGKTVEVFQ